MNAPIEKHLSVSLVMTEEIQAQLRKNENAISVAAEFVIDSHEMAEIAAEQAKAFKKSLAKVEELKKGFVAPAKQIIENAQALFNPAIQALEEAERTIKTKLLTWNQEQERIAAEARRKAEEEARKARQEAEAKAAEERAKAQAEAEQKRKEAEAAAASGNTAEAAKLQEQANAVIENGKEIALQAQLEAAALSTTPVPEVKKIVGFSTRDNWISELHPGTTEQEATRLIALALVSRPELIALLKLDWTAANKMAKALKRSMNIPGLISINRPVAVSK